MASVSPGYYVRGSESVSDNCCQLWSTIRQLTEISQFREDTVCLLRYDVRERIEENQDYIERFDTVSKKLHGNEFKIRTENELKRFFLEELLLAPNRKVSYSVGYKFCQPTHMMTAPFEDFNRR